MPVKIWGHKLSDGLVHTPAIPSKMYVTLAIEDAPATADAWTADDGKPIIAINGHPGSVNLHMSLQQVDALHTLLGIYLTERSREAGNQPQEVNNATDTCLECGQPTSAHTAEGIAACREQFVADNRSA
jgi:hypothetical protein